MVERPDGPPEAAHDDPETVESEPSIATIIERIRQRSVPAGQSSGNAQGPHPFARSKNSRKLR